MPAFVPKITRKLYSTKGSIFGGLLDFGELVILYLYRWIDIP